MQAFGRCRHFRLYTLPWSCHLFHHIGLKRTCSKHQRKFWERIFASLRALQTPGKIWSESCWQFCIHISSLYNFPDDHALFLFHLSNAWKRFQWSANSLLKELHEAKMRTSKSEEINIVSAWCQILLFWRCCNAWAMTSANVYNANSDVIREFVATSKSACDRFSLASF